MTSLMLLADTKPAGGAAIAEVIAATGGAVVVTSLLLLLAWGHRTGRIGVLGRLAGRVEAVTGVPGWAVLPSQIAAVSLIVALLGMYWDISLHIDRGRDEGPLANPAHYLILIGLYGVFTAGLLAVVLPEGKPSRSAIRIAGDWYAPMGAVALLATSAFALSGFPLDDVWHRLFGQDVTLWGPTHLMLIGGAGLSLIGVAALIVEGGPPTRRRRRAKGAKASSGSRMQAVQQRFYRIRFGLACGGFLIGLSTFQAEFDFGVPQFRLLFQPVLIAAAAGIALVAARIYVGRWGALQAAVYFILMRGLVSLAVGPGFGETLPHFPLYLAEAAVVELAAAVVGTRRPYLLGAVAGGLIGTVGFAAEYGWSQVWMPIPWPEALIGEAILAVVVTGIAAGMIGGFIGSALTVAREPRRAVSPSMAPAAAGLVAIVAVIGFGLQTEPEKGITARVTLEETASAPTREANALVRIRPDSATDDADWLNVTAWQGGGLVVSELEETGPGTYRTDEPIPLHGEWKSLIRLHREDSIAAVPVFLPEDSAIPAPAVPAPVSFQRGFVSDHEILQRERKDDVAALIPVIAYLFVGAIVLSLILLLGWTLMRLGSAPPGRGPGRTPRAAPVPTGGRA